MIVEPRRGSTLLPYQQRWVADPSPLKLCEKSRRIGISWASASGAALTAARQNGMNVWYISYNQSMTKTFVHDVANWAKHFELAASDVAETVLKNGEKDVHAYVVRFASGFEVTGLSSNVDNIRSKGGRVILDEAAFIPDIGAFIKAAMAFNIWGGQVEIISTHDGAENPFNSLVQEVREGRRPGSIHRITFDEAVADGLYERIKLVLEAKGQTVADKATWVQDTYDFYGEDADEELRCIPRRSAGAYLPAVLVENAMEEAPVVRLELPDEFGQRSDEERRVEIARWCDETLLPLLSSLNAQRPHSGGVDFGRVIDLSFIMLAALEQDLRRRAPFAVELRNVPYRQQEQILFYIFDRIPNLMSIALDATGPGATLSEFAADRYGSGRVEEVAFSEQWYATNFPPYKAALQDRMMILPRDEGVLGDHRAVQVINGVPKLPKSKNRDGAGRKRHGDSAIAGCLAYYASRRDPPVYDYRPVRLSTAKGDAYDRPVRTGVGWRRTQGGL